MNDYHFLPSIELELISNSDEEIEAFRQETCAKDIFEFTPSSKEDFTSFNLDQMNRYIQWQIRIRYKSKDMDGNDNTTVIASPMVFCKKEYFEKYNGYNISEADVASYERRLCPNIEEKAF